MKTNTSIEKLLDGANTFVVATNKGTGIVGERSEVLSLLTLLLRHLKENGVSKETLNLAVNLACEDEEEAFKNFEKEIDNKISSLIDEAMKGLFKRYGRE